jgi:hypothetical protein
MPDYRDRTKRYHSAIKQILLQEWDPIGVNGIPEAQDEYDSYVWGVYSRLIRQASEQELFDYLWEMETVDMGLYGNASHTQAIVEKLMALKVKLES